jgi:hypothetical protein
MTRSGRQSSATDRGGVTPPGAGRRAPGNRGRRATAYVALSVLFLAGLSARSIVQWDTTHDRPSSPPGFDSASSTGHPSNARYTDAELRVAANQLFASVKRSIAEDSYLPEFARDKIAWLITEQRSGALSISLLKNASGTNLSDEDLMASGTVDGREVIVIAQPRFSIFLAEGGRISAPFGRQQVNDFMLALVHETVHLQNASRGNPASISDRLREELRAWRQVDVNVVRQLRQLSEPMNRRFVDADDALRACLDKEPCPPLMEILAPTEQSR